MKNTFQKSIVKVEKMFGQKILVILVEKIQKKSIFSKVYKIIHFENPHEKIFKNIIMTREIMKKIF